MPPREDGSMEPCRKHECKFYRPLAFKGNDHVAGGEDWDCLFVHELHLRIRMIHETMGVHAAENSSRNQAHEDVRSMNQNLAQIALLAGAPLDYIRPTVVLTEKGPQPEPMLLLEPPKPKG